jgi:predicted transcriptional regulator of viral defense system
MEQTLLDALMQPRKCGGEAVVLEAWENGVSLMDADRMADHLSRIHRDDLSRRVGAMLRLLGRTFSGTKLDLHLESIQATVDGATEVPLMSGLDFPELDSVWMVRVP